MTTYMDNSFSNWLIEQMQERDWSQADLARRTSLSRQAIANYVSGRIPDEKALHQISRAFKLSPILVFRAAGLLPAEPDSDEWVEEMTDKISQIKDQSRRSMAKKLLEALVDEERSEEGQVRKNKPK
jgi:transcriptional regulator with XRE-family HTH domain